jgi:galactose mutarotase-like enzyme
VDANQGSPVPISFGFHPYLTLPGVRREEWEIAVPVETHLLLDDNGIPTGETEPAGDLDGVLGDRTFDDAYTHLDGDFVLEGGGRDITVSFETGYPYAQLYAPEGQPLICFEPMTAPTNALVSGEARILDLGETFSSTFRIHVTNT